MPLAKIMAEGWSTGSHLSLGQHEPSVGMGRMRRSTESQGRSGREAPRRVPQHAAVAVRSLATQVSRLQDRAAVVPARVDGLAGVSAHPQLLTSHVEEPPELVPAIEGGDELMTAFVRSGS